jgi:ferric-dicitrate binding protein FerR (iron transport regulator)
MDNRYLWDRTGDPDPEIQKLENLLGQFAYQQSRPAPSRRWPAAIAAAALIAVSSWLVSRPLQSGGWEFERLSAKGDLVQNSMLANGGVLETDSVTRAKLHVGDIGTVQLDPDTHVKLISNRERDYRIVLEHGTIHALITAPPRNFYVSAAGGTAVDLGCKYTMQVDRGGDGRVEVEMGWVAFESQGKESFIPAGAVCSTSKKKGPGIPVMLTSPGFRSAVAQFESGTGSLEDVLASASKDDAFSLWHVLQRVSSDQRAQVYSRLSALSPAPSGVTPEGIARLDGKMLDAWWDSFGLMDAEFWRQWKAPQ